MCLRKRHLHVKVNITQTYSTYRKRTFQYKASWRATETTKFYGNPSGHRKKKQQLDQRMTQ